LPQRLAAPAPQIGNTEVAEAAQTVSKRFMRNTAGASLSVILMMASIAAKPGGAQQPPPAAAPNAGPQIGGGRGPNPFLGLSGWIDSPTTGPDAPRFEVASVKRNPLSTGGIPGG